jgi:hypothetical protein
MSSQEPAPDEAEDLGPLLDEFRAAAAPAMPSLIGLLVIFLALLVLVCFQLVTHYAVSGWPGVYGVLVTAGVGLGIGLPAIVLGLLLRWRRTRSLVVRAFAEGLVRTQNGRSEVVRWDDILDMGFLLGDESGMVPLQLRTRDGRTLTLDHDLERCDVLQFLIEAETFSRLWPGVLERFLAGERIVFGRLRADRRGLTVEGYGFEVLPWHHIDRIDLEGGGRVIRVRQTGALLNWFRGGIPNQHLFLALVDHVRHHGPPP